MATQIASTAAQRAEPRSMIRSIARRPSGSQTAAPTAGMNQRACDAKKPESVKEGGPARAATQGLRGEGVPAPPLFLLFGGGGREGGVPLLVCSLHVSFARRWTIAHGARLPDACVTSGWPSD